MTKEKMDLITKEMNALYGCNKEALKVLVRRSYRVIDLSGASKDVLVSYALEAKFGRRALETWNAQR